MPKFSIITPIHLWRQERVDKFLKCIQSVENQTFKDYEWIIIDDGSTLEVDGLWLDLLNKGAILHHKEHNERVLAYNDGFGIAKGDWFVFLDSDDELSPDYLEEVNKAIKKYPSYKMFNFGSIMKHKDGGIAKRGPFQPKKLKVGHEVFGGGNIVNGTFVFHRSIWEHLGGYGPANLENGHVREIDCTVLNYPQDKNDPNSLIRDLFLGTPYDFSAWAQLEFPELQKIFMVKHPDHPKHMVRELGNPWGQDFYLFYKYTRKYHSKSIDKNLYIVNLK